MIAERERLRKDKETFTAGPERAYFPVYGRNDSVIFYANSGEELAISPSYDEPHFEEIKGTNEKNKGALFLYATTPSDILIARTTYETADILRNEYAKKGIYVANALLKVDAVDVNALNTTTYHGSSYAVLSENVIAKHGGDYDAHYRWGRKDQAQQYWQEAGVPTPPSAYVRLVNGQPTIYGDQQALEAPEQVVNICGGNGGYGVSFVRREQVKETVLNYLANEPKETIQIQPKLDLISSPCAIANLTEQGVDLLQISTQRFNSPGAHGGGHWSRNLHDNIEHNFPGFTNIVYDSLNTMQSDGVRGQVNLDYLLTEGGIYVREANIRPAGSSVILRLRETNATSIDTYQLQELTDREIEGILNSNDNRMIYNINNNIVSIAVFNE